MLFRRKEELKAMPCCPILRSFPSPSLNPLVRARCAGMGGRGVHKHGSSSTALERSAFARREEGGREAEKCKEGGISSSQRTLSLAKAPTPPSPLSKWGLEGVGCQCIDAMMQMIKKRQHVPGDVCEMAGIHNQRTSCTKENRNPISKIQVEPRRIAIQLRKRRNQDQIDPTLSMLTLSCKPTMR